MKKDLKDIEIAFEKFAAKLVLAEAWSRKEAINHLTHRITGGLNEFYKARLAEKNNLMDWVAHWDREVYGIIEKEFLRDLQHSIRGFSDMHKVYDAVKAERISQDSNFRRVANNVVKNDFKLLKLEHDLNDGDRDKFWSIVDRVVELALD